MQNHESAEPVRSERRYAGSMTVEAAIVLPMFLAAMILVAYLMNMLYVHREVAAALENTCRQGAASAYALEHLGESITGEEGLNSLSVAAVQTSVSTHLMRKPLVNKLLTGTVSCLRSQVLEDGQTIDVAGTYTMKFPLPQFALPAFTFSQHARMHAWVGYEPAGGAGTADAKAGQIVYVAETGTVYHTDPACSYLNPSIRKISGSQVGSLRSRDGSIYHACELCHPGAVSSAGSYYVTDYGDRYHTDPACSGLKRTVTAVPLADIGALHPCSKCGGHL